MKYFPKIQRESLYEETYFKDSNYIVRLIAIGKAKNPEYDSKYPELLQITYESDILPFIYNRFRKYLYQKKHHPQWDETGQNLFKLVEKAESFDEFLSNVDNLMS